MTTDEDISSIRL